MVTHWQHIRDRYMGVVSYLDIHGWLPVLCPKCPQYIMLNMLNMLNKLLLSKISYYSPDNDDKHNLFSFHYTKQYSSQFSSLHEMCIAQPHGTTLRSLPSYWLCTPCRSSEFGPPVKIKNMKNKCVHNMI